VVDVLDRPGAGLYLLSQLGVVRMAEESGAKGLQRGDHAVAELGQCPSAGL
jgi:hypothetical protein